MCLLKCKSFLKLSTKDWTCNLFFKASSFRMSFSICRGFIAYQKVLVYRLFLVLTKTWGERHFQYPHEETEAERVTVTARSPARTGGESQPRRNGVETTLLTSALGCLPVAEKLSQVLPFHYADDTSWIKWFFYWERELAKGIRFIIPAA